MISKGILKRGKVGISLFTTGSGKTYVACIESYRFLKYTSIKKILFLIDRNNLERQVKNAFNTFEFTSDGQKMGSLYSIDCLKGREDLKSDIVISTIQKLFKVEPVLYGVNGWNRFNQTRDFLNWFYTEVDRYVPLGSVAQSEVFGQVWARDSSVVAYAPSSRAAGDVLRLVNLVRRTCGFRDE